MATACTLLAVVVVALLVKPSWLPCRPADCPWYWRPPLTPATSHKSQAVPSRPGFNSSLGSTLPLLLVAL